MDDENNILRDVNTAEGREWAKGEQGIFILLGYLMFIKMYDGKETSVLLNKQQLFSS